MRVAAVSVLAIVALALAGSAQAMERQIEKPEAGSAVATVSGVYLTTKYPALSVRAGQTTTIDLELDDYGLPPQRVGLRLSGAVPGWTATLLGGGQPIAAAIVKPDSQQPLQLRLESQPDVKPGTYTFVVEAATADGKTQRLPLDITIGKQVPAKLKLTASLPALRGTPATAFKFQATVVNDSGHDAVINFATDLPKTFEATFTEGYGTQQVTGLPIKAGQSKDVNISVTPSHAVAAGKYPFKFIARSDQASAELALSMDIVGEPQLSVTGEGERLSADAYAGKQNPITLIVRNTGSETARKITLSASAPQGWKTVFDPKVVPQIAPGGEEKVVAMVTPSDRAIAGDYQTSFTATPQGEAGDSAAFRVTVETSTLWGIVGVGVIAAALLVVTLAVVRFGRR